LISACLDGSATPAPARQSRNQTRKSSFHHEGTKNTKETFSRKGAKDAKKIRFVISTEGRNLFQIPRIPLGMTGLARHFAFLAFLRLRSGQAWRDEKNQGLWLRTFAQAA